MNGDDPADTRAEHGRGRRGGPDAGRRLRRHARRGRPHPAVPHRPVGRGGRHLDAARRRPRVRRTAGGRRPARARPRRPATPASWRASSASSTACSTMTAPAVGCMRSASCTASASSGANCATSRTAPPTPAAGSHRRRRAASAWGSSRGTRSITCARTRRADGEPSDPMHSEIAIRIAAPPDLVFALAHDVERWADLLPHYARSVAVDRRSDGSLVADFIACRPLIGVLGLGLPVTWRSRTWSEPATRRLRFVHVAGATRGMDVTWRIEPATTAASVSRRDAPRDDRARIRAPAAGLRRVRRSVLHPADRGPDAGDVQGPGRGDA